MGLLSLLLSAGMTGVTCVTSMPDLQLQFLLVLMVAGIHLVPLEESWVSLSLPISLCLPLPFVHGKIWLLCSVFVQL